jgi:hypothetical protein
MSAVKQYGLMNYVKSYEIGDDTWVVMCWIGERVGNFTLYPSQSAEEFDRQQDVLFKRYEYFLSSNIPEGCTTPWTEEEMRSGSYKIGIWSKENTEFLVRLRNEHKANLQSTSHQA